MNKHAFFWAAPFLVTAAAALAASPTSGEFVTDPQSQNVQDASTEALTTAGEILCYMASTRPDLMVNQGTYTALVDRSKCSTSALSDASNSTQTTTAGAVSYQTFSMTGTRADNQSPQIGTGHVDWTGDGDGDISIPIFIRYSQTQAPSASAPNGDMNLVYASRLQDAKVIDGVAFSAGDLFMKGQITTSGTSVSFAETSDFGLPRLYVTRLFVDGNVNAGSGAVTATQWANSGTTLKTYRFGYNSTHFCRTDEITERCFFRAENKTLKSVWRYGVYNADGSRFDTGTPGFSVTNTVTGESGWASYWGIWFPTQVLDGARLAARDGTPYTVKKAGGRLTKFTKTATTLDNIAINRFNVWVSANTSTVNGQQFVQHDSYEMYWDAVNARFVVVGRQDCSNNCYLQTFSKTVSITPAQLNTLTNSWGIHAWSSSVGNINIPSSTLTGSNHGSITGGVIVSSNTVVLPGDTSVPATLKCVQNCIDPALLGGATFLANPQSSTPFTAGTAGSGQTAASDVVTYTWSASDYTLKLNGVGVSASSLSAIDTDKLKQSNYRWGINGGVLADGTGNHFSSGGAFDCDAAGSGTALCESTGIAKVSTYYRFETGLNDWNTSTFLTEEDGTYLKFSAPIKMAYTVPNDSALYGDYSGARMNLDFMGFGDLNGVPGRCISPENNEEVSCDSNSRWYPAFTLPDGAEITAPAGTAGGTDKYVKYLDRELRFMRDPNATAASLGITFGDLTALPDEKDNTTVADDPSNASSPVFAGAWDANRFKVPPKVIQGELQ
jgi:hypothetical protein